jgi:hypothetical protein
MTTDERDEIRRAWQQLRDIGADDDTHLMYENLKSAASVLLTVLTDCPRCKGTGRIDIKE